MDNLCNTIVHGILHSCGAFISSAKTTSTLHLANEKFSTKNIEITKTKVNGDKWWIKKNRRREVNLVFS